jgi:hypothetical protein
MSAENDFAQAVAMLSSLNTISQSAHGSDANLEYLQNELFNRIRSMVSNNRRDAIRQQNVIRYARQLEENRIRDEQRQRNFIENVTRLQQMTATTTPIPVSRTVSRPPVRSNPLENIAIVAKKKLEDDCPNDCAICQERPKFKDAVCTECEHYYCKTCWTGWMDAEGSNKSCPTCRKEMPRTTSYKARASSKPVAARARPMIIEEDDY